MHILWDRAYGTTVTRVARWRWWRYSRITYIKIPIHQLFIDSLKIRCRGLLSLITYLQSIDSYIRITCKVIMMYFLSCFRVLFGIVVAFNSALKCHCYCFSVFCYFYYRFAQDDNSNSNSSEITTKYCTFNSSNNNNKYVYSERNMCRQLSEIFFDLISSM